MKERKPGINVPITCKGCGKHVGYVTLKPRLKWRTIKWAIGLGLLFETIANVVVYLIFNNG